MANFFEQFHSDSATSQPQQNFFAQFHAEQPKVESPMQTHGIARDIARAGRAAAIGVTGLADIPIMAADVIDRINLMNLILPKNEKLDAEKRKLLTLLSTNMRNFIDRNTDNTLQPQNRPERIADIGTEIVAGAPALAKEFMKGAKYIAKKVPDILPIEYKSAQPLLNAEGAVLFSKTPNKLKEGQRAITGINEQYDIAKTKVNESEKALRKNAIDIEAPDFIPEIEKNINFLSSKVAPGSNDSLAINSLSNILKKLGTKEAPSTSTFGVPNNPLTINSNDALEIRKSINNIMSSPTFPTSGKDALLRVKYLADDVLNKGAEINKDFGQRWGNYKVHSQDIASRFINNDALKPFWQPEDYVAWKASQNAAKEGRNIPAIADVTETRANKFLENLNKKDVGGLKAVLNVLPPKEADDIMRQAFILAKKNKISLGNATLQILSIKGAPKGIVTGIKAVVGKGGKTPMETYIKNVKKIVKESNKPN